MGMEVLSACRDPRGDFQITVFTAPTPFRAGPVDISVFVQDPLTGELIPEARVTVRSPHCDAPLASQCTCRHERCGNKQAVEGSRF